MNGGKALFLDGGDVSSAAISLRGLEAVAGVFQGIVIHKGVALDLGDDGSSGDRRALAVALHHVHLTLIEMKGVAIEQNHIGLHTLSLDLGNSAGKGQAQALGHAQLVDVGRGRRPRPFP